MDDIEQVHCSCSYCRILEPIHDTNNATSNNKAKYNQLPLLHFAP